MVRLKKFDLHQLEAGPNVNEDSREVLFEFLDFKSRQPGVTRSSQILTISTLSRNRLNSGLYILMCGVKLVSQQYPPK
jgi:hypothetical protein